MDVINLISKPDGLPDEPVDKPGEIVWPMSCVNGPRVHQYLQEMNRKVLSRSCIHTIMLASEAFYPIPLFRLRYDYCWRDPMGPGPSRASSIRQPVGS